MYFLLAMVLILFFRLFKPLSSLRKLPITATGNWKMKGKNERQLYKH